ncbi:type III PLP-dependent enzyme [Shewanella sp. VB17]|uniref:type III PLP-dependent enzyme n=1 Tax=Shewanella sp. VB17 TaxID=2739432 RepID=UPI0015649552|nr:type III PLP-dependent enzyme [Shewanella sp. VB17]NRD75564.1 type III PLP-dependent enzyme [Shewanella sp. VB17]
MDNIIHTILSLKAEESSQTPLCAYLYDLDELQSHATAMVAALPSNCELYYAAKANPEAEILAKLAPIVQGFEAASGGELNWLHECQPQVPLIFGGPGKLLCELSQAIDLNVDAIHVESLTELQRIGALCQHKQRHCRILLRMNISLEGIAETRLTMGGKPTPFGIDACELDAAMALIGDLPTLAGKPLVELVGFHFHLMSHQLDVARHLDLMALYFSTFKNWCQRYNVHLPLLNVGGGIGVNYADPQQVFDWSRFCAELQVLITKSDMEKVKIRFECGRFVTAAMGYYVMQVLDIKKNHGQWFAIAHGGTHHFRTPAAQDHNHPFFVLTQAELLAHHNVNNGSELSANPEKDRTFDFDLVSTITPILEQQRVTLVGQLCTPKDVLAKQQYVDKLAVGDYLVFTHAGAYAWNISHQNFLMHAPPKRRFISI